MTSRSTSRPTRRAPAIDRSRAAVVKAATRLLVESPSASLAEIAAGIGIGRTTLHRMFPTRDALLAAVAHDAIDHLERVYAEVHLTVEDNDAAALVRVHRLVELLIPLGPRLMFLLRVTELDDDEEINRRSTALDDPVRRAFRNLQATGELDPSVSAEWILETLHAVLFIAWEAVDRGRLAAVDAPELVMRTWLRGVARPEQGSFS